MFSSAPHQTVPRRCQPATRIPVICVVDPQSEHYQGWDTTANAYGVQFRIVATADEALRLSRTQPVDLWVVNTKLSGLSGCELCSMIKSRSGHTPVYLVADQYSPEEEQAALRARATLFCCKAAQQTWLGQWLVDHAHGRATAAARSCVARGGSFHQPRR